MKQYTRVPYTLFQSKLWKEPRVFSAAEAYVDLIRRATQRPSKIDVFGAVVTLEPGEMICSVPALAKAWNHSEASVSEFLQKLQTLGAILRQDLHGVSIISLNLEYVFAEAEKKSL